MMSLICDCLVKSSLIPRKFKNYSVILSKALGTKGRRGMKKQTEFHKKLSSAIYQNNFFLDETEQLQLKLYKLNNKQ